MMWSIENGTFKGKPNSFMVAHGVCAGTMYTYLQLESSKKTKWKSLVRSDEVERPVAGRASLLGEVDDFRIRVLILNHRDGKPYDSKALKDLARIIAMRPNLSAPKTKKAYNIRSDM